MEGKSLWKIAFYLELEKFANAQLVRFLIVRAGSKSSGIAGGKMLAEAAGFKEWNNLTDKLRQDTSDLHAQLSWDRWARRPMPGLWR